MNQVVTGIIDILLGRVDRDVNFSELRGNWKDGATTISELLMGGRSDSGYNLVPCDTKGDCKDLAVFVSLIRSPKGANLKADQLIPLERMLPKMVQQVLGSCFQVNRRIALITDQINTSIFEPWLSNLSVMRRLSIEFNIYYIQGGRCQDITSLILDNAYDVV